MPCQSLLLGFIVCLFFDPYVIANSVIQNPCANGICTHPFIFNYLLLISSIWFIRTVCFCAKNKFHSVYTVTPFESRNRWKTKQRCFGQILSCSSVFVLWAIPDSYASLSGFIEWNEKKTHTQHEKLFAKLFRLVSIQLTKWLSFEYRLSHSCMNWKSIPSIIQYRHIYRHLKKPKNQFGKTEKMQMHLIMKKRGTLTTNSSKYQWTFRTFADKIHTNGNLIATPPIHHKVHLKTVKNEIEYLFLFSSQYSWFWLI